MRATFELESIELELTGGPIAGVDEAGRGPLAGPVVAAAVILDPAKVPEGIAGSKHLDAEARREVYRAILAASEVGIGVAGADRIDADGIHNAALWAMADAVAHLGRTPKLALIDGSKAPRLACPVRTIAQGDARCLSIAAASLVAKVARDAMMDELAREYPNHGFERHRGYSTAEHFAAIARYGVTPHHRRSFKPVQLALGLI